jgi:hypothetical protein
MDAIYRMKDLPVEDFRKLGLYLGGAIQLEKEDLDALLTGKRTALIPLRDLKAEGFRIEQLDARLSLAREPDGTLNLKLHPVYREAQQHPMLSNSEAEQLKTGQLANIAKAYAEPGGKRKTHVFEYDEKTREFVYYDPETVKAPDRVNNQELDARQKETFRNGGVVGLDDGTQFQYHASNPKGIRANRTGLILSILVDGGISYLLLSGLKALFGKSTKQLDAHTEGYGQAQKDMEARNRETEKVRQREEQSVSRKEFTRGYNRGASR